MKIDCSVIDSKNYAWWLMEITSAKGSCVNDAGRDPAHDFECETWPIYNCLGS